MNEEEKYKRTDGSIPSPLQQEIGIDDGHLGLMKDVNDLHRDARNYQFHDYKNTKYPMPKVALIATLERIISRAKNGYYNNRHIS